MKAYSVIHRLAVGSLVVLAWMGAFSTIRSSAGSSGQRPLQIVAGIAIWSFRAYLIGHRPRRWGLGVGILLLVMLAFQTHLFRLSHVASRADLSADLRTASVWTFALYETPLVVAAVCCILLRWIYPGDPRAGE